MSDTTSDTAVAIITGGASGLGLEIATAFAADGLDVVVADVKPADGPFSSHTVDVTKESDVETLVDGVRDRHGRLDVLVCSAAVETRASALDTTDDAWRRVLDVNLKGPFLCMRHAIPLMAESGGGSVILMGSVLGSIGSPGYAAYCASKGALVNLAKQAAIEHAADGVRVNVISPTACEAGLFLETIKQAPDPEAIKQMVASRTPMQRLGAVADVIGAARFLASDDSAYISGSVVPLDGGLAARRM